MNDWETFGVTSDDCHYLIEHCQKLFPESGSFSFVPSVRCFNVGGSFRTSDDWKIHACSRICLST